MKGLIVFDILSHNLDFFLQNCKFYISYFKCPSCNSVYVHQITKELKYKTENSNLLKIASSQLIIMLRFCHWIQNKTAILSEFPHPSVVPNQFKFLSSAEHKRHSNLCSYQNGFQCLPVSDILKNVFFVQQKTTRGRINEFIFGWTLIVKDLFTYLHRKARRQTESDEVSQFGEVGIRNGHEVNDGCHLLRQGERMSFTQP